MSPLIRIPLNNNFQDRSLAPSPRPGFRINLPISQARGSLSVGQGRQEQVLRAVAAAAALSDPAQAMMQAKVAKDDPPRIAASHKETKGNLPILLDPVSKLLDDRSNPPDIKQEHRTIAQAFGADPVLVAKANEVIAADIIDKEPKKTAAEAAARDAEAAARDADAAARDADAAAQQKAADAQQKAADAQQKAADAQQKAADAQQKAADAVTALEAGINWVATIDSDLLDRAAKAGARVKGFELVPTPSSQLEQLNNQVQAIEGNVQGVKQDVQGVKQDVQGVKQDVERVNKRVDDIEAGGDDIKKNAA